MAADGDGFEERLLDVMLFAVSAFEEEAFDFGSDGADEAFFFAESFAQ